jgi:hypothetical protein
LIAVSTAGQKERRRAGDMRADFGAQHRQVLAAPMGH